jgi:hypothetical protein
MLEKDIENLIAQNPDIFFPNSGFKLIGQQVKLGRCYADIVFEDTHKRKIIVEVKRGILSRDASGQVMEYYGLLKNENPEDFVELILCANIIPPERKKFLETIGIECKELGINMINQIAQEVNYEFLGSRKTQQTISVLSLPIVTQVWIFQGDPNRYDILNALADEKVITGFHWKVSRYKDKIAKGHIGLIWISGKEAGIYAISEIISDPDFYTENEIERKYWIDSTDEEGSVFRVKMKIIKNLINNPLTRETIKNTGGLQNLSILKQPRGTNFSLTPDEWIILKQLIDK